MSSVGVTFANRVLGLRLAPALQIDKAKVVPVFYSHSCQNAYSRQHPFAELCANSEHGDGKDAILHDKKVESWRQDPERKNQYNNVQRPNHWKARAKEVSAMDMKEFILAKCLKGQSDIEIITEKDYISHPKPNGYRSLHLTIRLPVFFAEKEIHVPVEIQLRTIAMDFWASLEHTIRYKKNLPINTEIETELKECADSSREWDSKMEHLLHILT